MLLNHIGITNKSREDALRFYRDFLGLEMTRESVVPQQMSEQIFAVSWDITMLVFEKSGTKIEVFICPECRESSPVIRHIGLSLENFSGIISRAEQAGVTLITGKTKDKTVYFIRDFSGNLVEIKQL
ncbi:MAG: VOC family protein [Nitrospiraceae bacterium]|nr:MAG: VOC family protein [Nitrospiraceae bacterium]